MALLDFLRRNVRPTVTAGAPGFAVHGGYVEVHEANPELASAAARYTLFSNMLANVSIIAAGVRFYLNLVGKASWKAEPADESALAQEIADHVKATMDGMATPWPRVVRRAAMYKFYGFSVQEWTAKRNADGSIGMADVAPRPQHTITKWDTDEATGEVMGIVQTSPQTFVEIYLPRTKVVYVVDDSLSDSPEGIGLLRHLVEPATRLQRLMQLEAFGYEVDLRGIPVAKAPLAQLDKQVKRQEITSAQATTAVQPVVDFIKKHIKSTSLGLVLDSSPYQSEDERATPSSTPQWNVELLKGDAASPMEAAAKAIERVTREVARIMGVEHLLLGGDGKGSLALSRDKNQSFGLIVDSTLTELEHVFKQDFARVITMLNGWPEELTPTLTTEKAQYRSVEEITQALVDLSTAGSPLAPGDPAVDEVRTLLGLSKVPAEIIDALVEAAMIGAQERTRVAAGGSKNPQPGNEDEPPPASGRNGEDD